MYLNGDGYIGKTSTSNKYIFKAMDLNGDGYISKTWTSNEYIIKAMDLTEWRWIYK